MHMIDSRRREARYCAADSVCGLLSFCLLLGIASPAVAQRSLNDLTGPWQLFVDDYLIASRTGASRVYHAFQKYANNPVLLADRPWEGSNVYLYGTVLPNETGGGYRMWYHGLPGDDDTYRLLYATSNDGLSWTKPTLGIVSYNGSTANNIFIRRSGKDHIPSVLHTPWDPDPQRRYKMINFDGYSGFLGAVSPDGIHWTDVPPAPLVPAGSDVGNFLWDSNTLQYRGYIKVAAYVNNLKRRAVGFSATADFQSWAYPTLILAPDAYDDRWVPAGTVQRTHFYGLCAFPYESMYIGFLWIFRATDVDGYYVGPTFVELVSSRDGVQWQREEGARPALLPYGPNGAWDDGMVFTTQHPLVEGGTIKLYYGGFDAQHGMTGHSGIGLATLRKDGFASLDAGASVGTVATKNLAGASGPLRVNVNAQGGMLRVEVRDRAGNVVPGYGQADCNSISTDVVDHTVTWGSHAELPAGFEALSLRFVLQNAQLYSFAVGSPFVALELPSVTRHPVSQVIASGGTASYSVEASGSAPLSYRWQKNGVDLYDGGHFAGTVTPVLTVTAADAVDVAAYRCVVSTPEGNAGSKDAALVLTPAFSGVGVAAGGTDSSVSGMTADGLAVCGDSAGKPFVWSFGRGLRGLGLPSGATTATAAGIGMFNGVATLAVDTNLSANRAQRWDGELNGVGVYSVLPRVGGSREWIPRALGTDGVFDLWIAGSTVRGGDRDGREAMSYQQSAASATVLSLPNAYCHDQSDAFSISDNGVAAGGYQYGGTAPYGGARNAFTAVRTALDTLVGPASMDVTAEATAKSRDGLVTGGWSCYSGGGAYRAPVVWFGAATPVQIPFLAGGDGDDDGEVQALSGDGSLAGGYSRKGTTGTSEAFIWDAIRGTRRLQDVLVSEHGMDLAGWTLNTVRAMSADGAVLAGTGTHNGHGEGWVVILRQATLPPVITVPPTPVAVLRGAPAQFAVVATGDGELAYQWQKEGVDLEEGGRCAGTSTPVMTISDAELGDSAEYRCLVSNSGGATASGAARLVVTVPSDFDRDGDVDGADFGVFAGCFNGTGRPIGPACLDADLNGDHWVDGTDFGLFAGCFNGSGSPPPC